MRIDIMTDIETLGTNTDSTIIQISAIAFDIDTGKHLHTFNQVVDLEKNEKPLQVTGGTLKWWLKTNKELLAALVHSGEHSSEQVLRNFHHWIKLLQPETDKKVYLWGNGILFDNKMIEHQLKGIGLDYPIFYRNDRDMRTLLDLTIAKLGISEQKIRAQFKDDSLVAHNAFDDVIYQIRLTTECYRVLTRNY